MDEVSIFSYGCGQIPESLLLNHYYMPDPFRIFLAILPLVLYYFWKRGAFYYS
jgi:hypothetical protein